MPMRPSRMFLGGILLVHALPAGALWAPQVPWPARAVSLGLLSLSAILAWRACHRARSLHLHFSPEGLFLESLSDAPRSVERIKWFALGPCRAVALHFAEGRPWHWVLMRDGMPTEAWRRLNVHLRWRSDVAVQVGGESVAARGRSQA